MIIGLVGPIGAGKSEVSSILAENDFTLLRFSDVIRNEAIKRDLPPTRESLQNLGDEMRKTHGADILAKILSEKIDFEKNFVIDGFRNPSEVLHFKNLPNFKLIKVDASFETRCERLLQRRRTDDPNSIDEFAQMDDRDRGINQPEHAQQSESCWELADITIKNENNLEQLKEEVRILLEKIK